MKPELVEWTDAELTLWQRELLVVRLSLWCERWLTIPVLSEAVLPRIVDPVPGSVGYSRAGN